MRRAVKRGGGSVAARDAIALRWPAHEDAHDYRVLVRDVETDRIIDRIEVSAPAADIPAAERERSWRWQYRTSPEEDWQDAWPYLLVPGPTVGPLHQLRYAGDEPGPYRFLVRDDAAGRIVASAGVPTPVWAFDLGRHGSAGMYRSRVQVWRDGAWQDRGRYEPLVVSHVAVIGERRASEAVDLHRADRALLMLSVDTEGAVSGQAVADRSKVVDDLILGQAGDRRLGVDLHMDLLEHFGWKGTFFVDVLLEYDLGREALERTVAAIASRGHDIQLHLHTHHLRHADDPKLRGLATALHGMDPDAFRRALAVAHELFVERVGVEPVAYRSGAYNVCDAYLRVLPEFGLTIDSSVNAFKNFHGSDWMRTRTQPFRYHDVLEMPVGWGFVERAAGAAALARLGPSRAGSLDPFLDLPTDRAAPLVLQYVSHSYQLLRRGERDGRVVFLPELDESIVMRMARLLRGLADAGGRAVTFADVHEQGLHRWDERPDVAADPISVLVHGPGASAMVLGRTYPRDLLQAGVEGDPQLPATPTVRASPSARATPALEGLHEGPAERLVETLLGASRDLGHDEELHASVPTWFAPDDTTPATRGLDRAHLLLGHDDLAALRRDAGEGGRAIAALDAGSYVRAATLAGLAVAETRRDGPEADPLLHACAGRFAFFDPGELATWYVTLTLRRARAATRLADDRAHLERGELGDIVRAWAPMVGRRALGRVGATTGWPVEGTPEHELAAAEITSLPPHEGGLACLLVDARRNGARDTLDRTLTDVYARLRPGGEAVVVLDQPALLTTTASLIACHCAGFEILAARALKGEARTRPLALRLSRPFDPVDLDRVAANHLTHERGRHVLGVRRGA